MQLRANPDLALGHRRGVTDAVFRAHRRIDIFIRYNLTRHHMTAPAAMIRDSGRRDRLPTAAIAAAMGPGLRRVTAPMRPAAAFAMTPTTVITVSYVINATPLIGSRTGQAR